MKEPDSAPSTTELQSVITQTVSALTEQGLLTPQALAQVFQSVANELNQQTGNDSQGEAKNKVITVM